MPKNEFFYQNLKNLLIKTIRQWKGNLYTDKKALAMNVSDKKGI